MPNFLALKFNLFQVINHVLSKSFSFIVKVITIRQSRQPVVCSLKQFNKENDEVDEW